MQKYKDFEYEEFSDGRVRSTFPNIGQMLFNSMDEFKAYVDGYHNTHEFIGMVETELRNAIEKHPKFCDDFSGADVEIVRDNLEFFRKANEGTQHADLVLLEEFYEAVEAYMNGDKKQCLKELAQCGAVIIRMMDFVKKEMEVK